VHEVDRIRWRGIVESRADASEVLPNTGDVALVSRGGKDRWLVFRCPSGCGTELPINLDERVGPAWRLYNPGSQMSLYPSVWRDSGCGAHFIVSRGRLWLLREDDWASWGRSVDEDLIESVANALTDSLTHYFDIAISIGAEPWETLWACRLLVSRGSAVLGADRDRSRFAKARP
jgi:hypothetical protein